MTSHSVKKVVFLLVVELFPLVYCRAVVQNQQTSPGAQDQQSAPEGQRRGRHVPTLDEQLKALTDRLNLDATQQGMVKVILERRQSELLDVHKDQSLSAVDRFHAMKAVYDRAYDRIGRVLNPEQSKKFELMRPHSTPLPHPDEKTIVPPRTPAT